MVVERERIRQLCLHALETLCVRLPREGRGAPAVEVGRRAAEAEPLRESARRALITAHLLAGETDEALRQYSSYRSLLAERLGATPSPLMQDLVAGIVAPSVSRDGRSL